MLVASGENSVDLGFLEQLRSYGTPGRDPRMRIISVAYIGFTASSDIVAGSDAADVRFWAVEDLAIDGIGFNAGLPLASRGDAAAPLRIVVPEPPKSSVISSPALWVPIGVVVVGAAVGIPLGFVFLGQQQKDTATVKVGIK